MPTEMELDLPPSPPPVEDTLAARRAKRQAILAKYAADSGISSAVVPPPTSSLSDPVSQTPHSAAPDETESNQAANCQSLFFHLYSSSADSTFL